MKNSAIPIANSDNSFLYEAGRGGVRHFKENGRLIDLNLASPVRENLWGISYREGLLAVGEDIRGDWEQVNVVPFRLGAISTYVQIFFILCVKFSPYV